MRLDSDNWYVDVLRASKGPAGIPQLHGPQSAGVVMDAARDESGLVAEVGNQKSSQ
jgi:hypothetical protein